MKKNDYKIGDIFKTNEEQREFIRKAKGEGNSFRRISEIIAEKYPELGVEPDNQLDGIELCLEAGVH